MFFAFLLTNALHYYESLEHFNQWKSFNTDDSQILNVPLANVQFDHFKLGKIHYSYRTRSLYELSERVFAMLF